MLKRSIFCIFASSLLMGCATTPSHQKSFRKNDITAINTLLANADINSTSATTPFRGKVTPLEMAAFESNSNTIEYLISKGANPNIKNPTTQMTPLHVAILSRKPNNVEALLKAGASTEAVDKDGFTPLAFAVEYDRSQMVSLLKKYGAEEDRKFLEVQRKNDTGSGFNWGKALALGVGTVAGGGLKLDSATQGSVLAGIVLDSMGDNEEVSNFEEAVGNAVQPSLETSTPVRSAGSSFAIESNLSSQTQLATNQASSPTSNGTVDPQLYVISYSKCIVKLQRPDLDVTDSDWLFTLYIWDYPNRIPAPARAEWQSINSQHATQSKAAIKRKVEGIVRDGGYAYDSNMQCDGGYGPSSEADYIQEQIDEVKATYERFKANSRNQVHWFRGN